jgi:hypothetical protein
MASTASNKPFHTYENVGYDEQQIKPANTNINYASSSSSSLSSANPTITTTTASNQIHNTNSFGNNNNNNHSNSLNFNNGLAQTTIAATPSMGAMPSCGTIAVNKAAIESPFTDPILVGKLMPSIVIIFHRNPYR